MKILVITTSLPFPPIWGFGTRVYQLLRYLSLHHEVTLLTYGADTDSERIAALQAICRAVHIVPPAHPEGENRRSAQIAALLSSRTYQHALYRSKQMQDTANHLLEAGHFDVVQVESSPLLAAIDFPDHTPVVLDEHNIEYELLGRTAREERSLIRKTYSWIEYLKCREEEHRSWTRATGCVFTSGREEAIMRLHEPHKPTCVVPNGVDPEYFHPSGNAPEPDSIVFTGLIRYRPNADAAVHFVNEILPHILRARPSACFTIVGAGPPEDVRRLASRHVVVTGQVSDVRLYVNQAAVFAVPLRMGSGTRLKVLEGLSMAKAMVTTAIGCEGIDVRHGEHLLIADDPREFAHAVIRLLDNKSLAASLGERGRTLVQKQYSWTCVGRQLEEFLEFVRATFQQSGPARP